MLKYLDRFIYIIYFARILLIKRLVSIFNFLLVFIVLDVEQFNFTDIDLYFIILWAGPYCRARKYAALGAILAFAFIILSEINYFTFNFFTRIWF